VRALGVAILAVGLLLAGLIVFAPKSDPGPSIARAENHCESLIRDRLKAPSTASFTKANVQQIGDSIYVVSGVVDAENAFSARIRTRFACTLMWEIGGFSTLSVLP
jgi:hypothetical protein